MANNVQSRCSFNASKRRCKHNYITIPPNGTSWNMMFSIARAKHVAGRSDPIFKGSTQKNKTNMFLLVWFVVLSPEKKPHDSEFHM